MSAEKSLIQFILDLLKDPKLLAEFKDDPHGVLSTCGLTEFDVEDVREAILLIQDNDEVSFDRDYETGGKFGGGSHGGGGHHTPPPPPVEHVKPGEHSHETAVKYLEKYVTNNHYTYNIDDRDTIVDNSINQNIDTGGGDFFQDIETNSVVASGDGAVAAGGNISDSTITTGNGNIVGDGNSVVDGDDNTVAFGNGSAYSVGDVSAEDGAGISFGGNASGNKSADNSFNTDETTTNVKNTTTFEDSFNVDTDNSTNTSVEDNSSTDILSNNDVSSTVDIDSSLV
ncbi:IniB N-terminal domain-containing protein [Pseudonocardia nematodicida]|uniref:IniB N-terminal domain-containing protein n=1 Tax=Pseudonocardia nematodicida TaxID=1206997 RepID=A0ABV1KKL7_9PSEU